MDLEEPAGLHVRLGKSVGLLGSRSRGTVAGNGSLEGGIKREGGLRAEAEGRGIDASVGTDSAAAVGEDASALATCW